MFQLVRTTILTTCEYDAYCVPWHITCYLIFCVICGSAILKCQLPHSSCWYSTTVTCWPCLFDEFKHFQYINPVDDMFVKQIGAYVYWKRNKSPVFHWFCLVWFYFVQHIIFRLQLSESQFHAWQNLFVVFGFARFPIIFWTSLVTVVWAIKLHCSFQCRATIWKCSFECSLSDSLAQPYNSSPRMHHTHMYAVLL